MVNSSIHRSVLRGENILILSESWDVFSPPKNLPTKNDDCPTMSHLYYFNEKNHKMSKLYSDNHLSSSKHYILYAS